MSSEKQIRVGNVKIGAGASISVQTMTNTQTEDIKSTVAQIQKATSLDCDIIRVSCPTEESCIALKEIIKQSELPIVADVHFNYKRALAAIESRAHCVRINPGNIGDEGIKEIIKSAKDHDISIRIGINSGSIEREILDKFGEPNVDALIESTILNVKKFEDLDFFNFKVSVKSSDVLTTISAYRKLSTSIPYPLHVGITEAGPVFSGTIKSSIAIGTLLADSIGDTIRVSLSSSIEDEIRVGKQILKSLKLLNNSVNVISCPTCSRTLIDVIEISNELEKALENVKKNLNISVLGCVVNGPGEAKEADIGVFGFKPKIAKIYLKGKEIGIYNEYEIVQTVQDLVNRLLSKLI
ncbi:MAG: flavodoxin-dependent (E)-4-hydroxy-3-methylbut-2-enyl-diphosphate synthase [Holosporales bacterium]|jgi:(E)-4-hydroxy-3-methylbut-2-enyl-diphosphate synthase|nr:flavodoxin-dependent (E)-4-hydroxy-3-methylbut-2-enyl-diphosphate synthase [Holosporales bacterium]